MAPGVEEPEEGSAGRPPTLPSKDTSWVKSMEGWTFIHASSFRRASTNRATAEGKRKKKGDTLHIRLACPEIKLQRAPTMTLTRW